jgi:hypothetical protein
LQARKPASFFYSQCRAHPKNRQTLIPYFEIGAKWQKK